MRLHVVQSHSKSQRQSCQSPFFPCSWLWLPWNISRSTHASNVSQDNRHALLSVARVSSVRAEYPCYPIRITVRTLNVGSLNWHRGRRSVSAGGKGFGEIWVLSEGESEKAETRINPVTLLLAWPTAVPEDCEEMGWE